MRDTESESNSVDTNYSVSLGLKLKAEREKRGISYQQVSAYLNLEISTIKQLESPQLEEFLPVTYLRGYYRSYISFLGLDLSCYDSDLKNLLGHNDLNFALDRADTNSFGDTISQQATGSIKLLATVAIVLLLILVAGLLLWNARRPHPVHRVSNIMHKQTLRKATVAVKSNTHVSAAQATQVTPVVPVTPTASIIGQGDKKTGLSYSSTVGTDLASSQIAMDSVLADK